KRIKKHDLKPKNMGFFAESETVRKRIRYILKNDLKQIQNKKIRIIIAQRNNSSSFIKGCISYFVAKGLGTKMTDTKLIRFATALELYCSSAMLLDNYIDKHYERNNHTTYLREFGEKIQVLASYYAMNLGLRKLLPFLSIYTANSSPFLYNYHHAVEGMVGTDLSTSQTFREQININKLTDGYFYEMPFIIAASLATKNFKTIRQLGDFGIAWGTGMMIYEELRDLLGEHGRRRATEVESGRMILSIHLAKRMVPNIKRYVGKKLTEQGYNELIALLWDTNSIQKTATLAKKFLSRAKRMLQLKKKEAKIISSLILDLEKSVDELAKKAFKIRQLKV
ncbi:MAG: hypothetical protein Q7K16_04165, partial [Candidatus Azambacteria bacterium]|nr:hypothetical protein [Candidatus Azambacteria bacterium]